MKKTTAVALIAVLSFGCAAPAVAADSYHGAECCLNCSELCQGVTQNTLTLGLQSLDSRLSGALAQANGSGAQAAGAGAEDSRRTTSEVDAYTTSPSLCANGACGLYLDENGDGVCDYHGQNCTNMGGSNYIDADDDGVCDSYGMYRQGTGTGYGSHHSSGHHGGHHR